MIKLPKPTIEDIIITEEQKQKLDKVLNPKSKLSSGTKHVTKIRILGGLCHSCADIPTKLIRYQLEDITLVERYCTECYDKMHEDNNK